MDEEKNTDLRELARAMNNLADAINRTNALFADAKNEDPNWQNIPTIITELSRKINMLCVRR